MHRTHLPVLRITVTLSIARCFLLFVSLGIFAVGRSGSAFGEGEPSERLDFDIPAQALATALDAYSEITGREIFYDGALVLGRRSAEVEGAFMPDNALRILLQGTDFVPRATGAGSFTIIRSPQAVAGSTGAIAAPGGNGDDRRYFAAVQAGLKQAFCFNPQTRPGGYQLVIRVWTGPSGAVLHSEILGSTGNRDRDRAFSVALQTLKIAEPPPATLPQPVTMAVLPPVSGGTEECSALADDRVAP